MCSSRRATVLALTLIPKSASARATLAVVRRDHFTPVIGSPAVSYSSKYSIRVTMSAVFFPRGGGRRPRGGSAPARHRDRAAVGDHVRPYADPRSERSPGWYRRRAPI